MPLHDMTKTLIFGRVVPISTTYVIRSVLIRFQSFQSSCQSSTQIFHSDGIHFEKSEDKMEVPRHGQQKEYKSEISSRQIDGLRRTR